MSGNAEEPKAYAALQTITVTNQDMQLPSPTYDTPAQGALTVIAGAIGILTEPYNGWLISASSTSGTVEISEAG